MAIKGSTSRNTRITPCNARRFNRLLALKELVDQKPVASYPRVVEAYRDYSARLDISLRWVETNIRESAWLDVPHYFNGEAE